MGAEQKLYKKLKAFTPQIIWNRVENLSLPGMPDLLGYNTSGRFFTVELKVTKGASCPAPAQGGKCRECRACWTKSIKNISYGKH